MSEAVIIPWLTTNQIAWFELSILSFLIDDGYPLLSPTCQAPYSIAFSPISEGKSASWVDGLCEDRQWRSSLQGHLWVPGKWSVSFCSVLPGSRVIGRQMIKMFQGWQVGAIYRQASCVCPPVCLLLDNAYLSGSLLNHLYVGLTVSLSICLLTSVHLYTCVSVGLGLSGWDNT